MEARGIEATADARLGIFRFAGSATYIDAITRGSGVAAGVDGFRPAQTPRFAASGTARIVPATGWIISATLRHVGAQFEDDLNTNVLPAATTLDTYAELALTDAVSVVFRGENLFDEQVITRNQGGSIDLGTPRTLWIGVRARIGR